MITVLGDVWEGEGRHRFRYLDSKLLEAEKIKLKKAEKMLLLRTIVGAVGTPVAVAI